MQNVFPPPRRAGKGAEIAIRREADVLGIERGFIELLFNIKAVAEADAVPTGIVDIGHQPAAGRKAELHLFQSHRVGLKGVSRAGELPRHRGIVRAVHAPQLQRFAQRFQILPGRIVRQQRLILHLSEHGVP